MTTRAIIYPAFIAMGPGPVVVTGTGPITICINAEDEEIIDYRPFPHIHNNEPSPFNYYEMTWAIISPAMGLDPVVIDI